MERRTRGDGRKTTAGLMPAALLLLFTNCYAASDTAERRFGIVPQFSPMRSAELWQPLLDHVNATAGARLRFATASSVAEFDRLALAGDYDYLFCNPLLFRELERKFGYRAIGRARDPLVGIIVVRNEGPRTLEALHDRTIAFPAPTAFGATIMNRATLRQRGVNHYVFHLSTHESVYRAVAQGRHIAGGGVIQTYEQLPEELRRELRILYRTPPIAAHVFAAHRRLPDRELQRVQTVLLTLHQNSRGEAVLAPLKIGAVAPVLATDFAAVDRVPFPHRIHELALHVLPLHDEAGVRAHMEPLAAYLGQRLDLKVKLRSYATMDAFERAVSGERRPSLVNANPLHAKQLVRRGFKVVAQQLPVNSPEGMRGLVLVNRDSPYRSLADLRGSRIAFGGSSKAFFATIVPKVMLRRAGLEGHYTDLSQAGPVIAVLPRLRDREVDAVGLDSMLLNDRRTHAEFIEGRMRVLAQSEPMPGLPWLVGPGMDADLAHQLRHLLLNFGAESPGHAAMLTAGIERMLTADEQSYNAVNGYLGEAGIR